MARGEIKLHFPDVQAGEGKGFNDGAIDNIFGVSLIRESIQNSLDQWMKSTVVYCDVLLKNHLTLLIFSLTKATRRYLKNVRSTMHKHQTRETVLSSMKMQFPYYQKRKN